jgi:hypothetical protein
MGPFLGQAVDALLGRISLRYQFEITPQFVGEICRWLILLEMRPLEASIKVWTLRSLLAGEFAADLPSGVTVVSLLWEKGSKVSYTDPADVSPQDHTAAFAQVMRQVCGAAS